MYYKKLKGEKVYLSPLDADDFRLLTRWVNNLKTTIKTGTSTILMSEATEYKYLQSKENSSYQFGIVTEDGDDLIGTIELMDINNINKTSTVGLFIGDEENRGQGYGKEAMNLILDYGFNILNLNSIQLNVFSFNTAAYNMYKSVGFKDVGIRREAYIIADRKIDVIIMDIIKSEFEYKNIKYLLEEFDK